MSAGLHDRAFHGGKNKRRQAVKVHVEREPVGGIVEAPANMRAPGGEVLGDLDAGRAGMAADLEGELADRAFVFGVGDE